MDEVGCSVVKRHTSGWLGDDWWRWLRKQLVKWASVGRVASHLREQGPFGGDTVVVDDFQRFEVPEALVPCCQNTLLAPRYLGQLMDSNDACLFTMVPCGLEYF